MKKLLTILCCSLLLCGCSVKNHTSKGNGTLNKESIPSAQSQSQINDENKEYFPKQDLEVPQSIKILAVGNSFSVDAMEYLYDILENIGVKEIILGNLYIGGCSIDQHADNIKHRVAAYTYYKNTDGNWTETDIASVKYGLNDEDWDIITMQQASAYSGKPESFSRITEVIDYINKNKTNPDAQLWWHMTWAYDKLSTHPDFPAYDKDQMKMYKDIVSCVKQNVSPTESFSGLIPGGTTMQNLRGAIGDNVTRDGHHANDFPGRYALAMTWACALTGINPSDITWAPDNANTDTLNAVKVAVTNALENPFSITQP